MKILEFKNKQVFIIVYFLDERFDKSFHVSVVIDGMTSDKKLVNVLQFDKAHNR